MHPDGLSPLEPGAGGSDGLENVFRHHILSGLQCQKILVNRFAQCGRDESNALLQYRHRVRAQPLLFIRLPRRPESAR